MSEKAVQDILLRIGITGDKSVEELKKRNSELLETFLKIQKEIETTQAKNKELSKAQGDNSAAIAENIAKIKESQAANKANSTEINQNITLITAEMGSLKEKRAQLSVMTAEYTKMSAAEKTNSDHGKQLKTSIADLTVALKAEEKQIGQTFRNVGNYTDSILEANKAHGLSGTMVGRSVTAFKGMRDAQIAAGEGTSILNGLMKMLAANPVMAIIAVAAIIFFALKDAIGSSSQATNMLKMAMAPLNVVMKIIKNVLVEVVEIFLGAFKAITSFGVAIADFIGGNDKMAQSIKNSMKVEQERQDLVKANRELVVEESKNALAIAKLRDQVTEKDKYTKKQRAEFLKDAIALEGEHMKKKEALAARELKNLEDELKVKDELNGEDKNRLADAQKKIIDVQTEFYQSTRRMKTQMATFNVAEDAAEAKAKEDALKKAEEFKKKKEELAAKELGMRRQSQDALLSLIKDGQEKELQILKNTHTRQLEDLKGNSKATNELRKSLIEQYRNEEAKIVKKYTEEEIQKEVAKATKEVELRLAIVKAGTDQELALKIQQINLMRASELEGAKTTGVEKALIEQKYNKQIEEANLANKKEQTAKMVAAERLHYENKIAQMRLDGLSTLAVELENEQQRSAALVQLNDETSDQFEARKLQSQQKISDIQTSMHNEQIQGIEQQQQVAEKIFSSLNSLGEIFGGNQEQLAKFTKALALFQIAVNTGLAISAGIASAMTLPFPANLVAVVTTIATVLSNVASAKKMLSSAGEAPKAPRLSTGGNVWGEGTGKSDSIKAYLSNGETVNNSASSGMFAPLYSALNQAGGGIPIQSVNKSAEVHGEQFLINAFSKSLLNMPRPIVAVEEIRRVEAQMSVVETMARQ
jgi:hypothetical protein